jgi:hypothetical protein
MEVYMNWLKNNKVIVINIIVVIIAAINAAITQELFPDWIVYLTWAVGILDAIRLAIVGQQLATIKAKIVKLTIK